MGWPRGNTSLNGKATVLDASWPASDAGGGVPSWLLGYESRAKVEAKVRAELAYLRQRLGRIEERLPARIEPEVVAARRVFGG